MPRPMRGVFRRGKSWYIRLREGGQDRWISLGSDYAEARRKARQIRSEGAMMPSRMTVKQAACKWLDTYVCTARNKKGQNLAEVRVQQYLVPHMGYKQLQRVKREDLRMYRLWLEKQGRRKPISAQTVAHILADARCLFGWAEDSGLIDKSPVPRNLLPRIQEKPPNRLQNEDLERLISLPEPYGFVIRLAVGSGLRWSELCRAQASHVENNCLVVSETKTGRLRRVPLSPSLLAEVQMRVGRLVPFREGSVGTFNRTVRRRSGLTRFHAHMLRHSYACRYLEMGGTLPALQQMLGHRSVSTTQRYANLSDQAVREEAARVYEEVG